MTNISRDSDVVELNEPPRFNYGQRVRTKRTVRNDGTYCGKDVGDVLAKKGEEGYVMNIGTFLQQHYIFGVEFILTGNKVGMKTRELEAVDDDDDAPAPKKKAPKASTEGEE
ncbi:nitrogen fixation protein NifZ [Beijerinckia indica]|uniref:NifZ family protein n=1 Tax=Beijerinckia indica subsp. indica (strain ATCC 9039 / DSM 1715 / NCIMB 8712) TaxID=395963 RepID=B2IE30_BEII9|nr:nitrogen fixation protein NifZ [Beijerinckia indica]ACB94054.1 NifZ family protein [Beijerinckia indica subsp. indica ATCC 9039]